MNPKQRGHRDAAWGVEQNPYDFQLMPASHDAWVDAKARVDAFKKEGRDPNGHAPRIPRLCERDVTKVCNCCDVCGGLCWAEKFEGTVERARTTVRDLLRKLVR